MIQYDSQQRIVVMDLTDLEHCGFDHDEFDSELRLRGIDDPNARFPFAIVVNVAGGHVLTPDTRQETVEAAIENKKRFHAWLDQINGATELRAACRAKALRESLLKMYSYLNYEQFCEYMGFNAKYAERYWDAFQYLAAGVGVFDNTNLQKIIDFGNADETPAALNE